MTHIGVILNPKSRRNRGRADAMVEAMKRCLDTQGEVYACGDPESLDEALIALKEAQVSVLAICGGDGTFGYVMSHAERVFGTQGLPQIALLRGGTMNTTANGLGVAKGSPLHLLKRLIQDLESEGELRVIKRPLMRGASRLGCLFGTGLVARYLEEYYRRGQQEPTPWTAFTTLSLAAGSALVKGPLITKLAAPDRMELTLNGRTLPPRDYVTVAAGTVPEFGLGFAPFPKCLEDSESFDMLAASINPAAFLIDLMRMRTGRSLDPAHGFMERTQQLTLTPCDGSEELLVMFDGDVMKLPAPLCVSVGPIAEIILGADAP